MSKRLTFSLLIFILLVYPALRGYALENKDADIIYKVTINRPAESEIDVVAIFNKSPDTNLIISERNSPKYLNLTGLKAKDEQERLLTINAAVMHKKKVYTIESKDAKVITVEYSVKPGTLGRHGHTGYLDERFGLIAGNNMFCFL